MTTFEAQRLRIGTSRGTAYTQPLSFSSGAAEQELAFSADDDAQWDTIVNKLLAIRNYEDDWDGDGARAPRKAYVDHALQFALALKKSRSMRAADDAYSSLNGEVCMVWNINQNEIMEFSHGDDGSFLREISKDHSRTYLLPS